MDKTVKTLSEIAAEYGVHVSTLRRWIKPIREELKIGNKKLLLPWQVDKIYQFLNSME